ncbi:serine/threonine-protein kinase [Micromonospora sp. WMMD964]|uniref:serine/threonine-protein kinase n=1 Tax=Micromonospora sp. WMMD964 TaxID=3016091 RepID=UPI00249CC9FE|nr:serine/threonine-protein kinase [Micromonospora sp. WMMD964]WFE98828.1 protein kinase [Micromonospora sp. WMMD964]
MPIVGQVIGDRYRLLESIASGGMGDVWRAVDETLDRCVAIKMLQPRLVTDAGFGERFRREARAMAALRHPGVAQVYDYGEVSEPDAPVLAYIVMECVQGQPLSEKIAEVGRLGVAETMSIAAQTARALQAAHDAGVVHRDVKPSNLVIEPDGHVVLVDFGVAVTPEAASLTGTNQVVGTALYMAPEQVTRSEITPAIDIYALGAVAYHCLAGRPPHQGDNAVAVALRHLEEEPQSLPDDVPAAVQRLVATAMAKGPARRFPTAGALATAAQALTDQSDQLLRTAVAAPVGAPAERTEVQGAVVGGAAKRSGGPGPKVLAALVGSMAAAAAVLVFADPTGVMPGRTGQPSTPPTVSPTVPSQRDPGPGGGGGEPATRGSAGLPVRATGSATTTPTPSGSAGAETPEQSTSPEESTEGGAEPTSSGSAPTTGPTGGPTAAPTETSSEEPEEEPAADPTKKPSAEESAAETSSAPQV